MEDMEKLEAEIKRLQAELSQCKKKPAAYVPSCQQDLTFQIQKLQEELARRRAQLAAEQQKVDDETNREQSMLAACLARPDGCPPDEEQQYKLQLMKAQQELERREGASDEMEQLVIYKCLYKHARDPTVKAAEELVVDSLRDGCGAMIGSKKGSVSPALQLCLCESKNKEEEMQAAAAAQAEQSEAVYQAEQREKTTEEQSEAEVAKESAALAEAEAKELIWHDEHLQSGYADKLKKLQEQYADELPSILSKAQQPTSTTPEAKVFSQQEIDACITDSQIREQETRDMINEVFASNPTGNPTGCALLSLADNDLLQKFHTCLCVDK